MIRRAFQSFLIVVALMAMVFACARSEGGKSSSAETQTISPAVAQTSPTDTDAMTQTVEVVDGRSEAEGGVLTSPNPPVKTGTATARPAATATGKKKAGSPKSPPGSKQ